MSWRCFHVIPICTQLGLIWCRFKIQRKTNNRLFQQSWQERKTSLAQLTVSIPRINIAWLILNFVWDFLKNWVQNKEWQFKTNQMSFHIMYCAIVNFWRKRVQKLCNNFLKTKWTTWLNEICVQKQQQRAEKNKHN